MESRKRTKNNKPLIFTACLIGFFILFIGWLIKSTPFGDAQKELNQVTSQTEIRNIWTKYQSELSNNPDFYREVVTKLSSLNPSSKQVEKIFEWLPDRREKFTNLVVVPDLSRRIIQENENPAQITHDTVLIAYLWDKFKTIVKSKPDSKDRFMIAMTDDDQARGDFFKIANQLLYDLKNRKPNERPKDILEQATLDFHKNIESLYETGKLKPSGADYWFYFDRKLPLHEKKSTLTEKFDNRLVIITDGYLEAERKIYTKLVFDQSANSQIKNGANPDFVLKSFNANIQPCFNTSLKNWKILMLEINERKVGKNAHYPILREYWADWFESMKYEDLDRDNFFVLRDDALDIAKSRIDDFIGN